MIMPAFVHGKYLLIYFFCILSLLASTRPTVFPLFLVFICPSLNCHPRAFAYCLSWSIQEKKTYENEPSLDDGPVSLGGGMLPTDS